jgi:hypothetical protein
MSQSQKMIPRESCQHVNIDGDDIALARCYTGDAGSTTAFFILLFHAEGTLETTTAATPTF